MNPNTAIPFPPKRLLKPWHAVVVIVTICAVTLGWWQFLPAIEEQLKENVHPRLPPADALPLVSLPEFRHTHPRLPVPSQSDIERLTNENPSFFQQHRNRARNGNGDLESTIMMARIEPGSQDLAVLHQRLMALKYTWRGHEQVKPIAMGYDWLYDQWTNAQRAELGDKLAEGCEYLINFIREERLSPYNVYSLQQPVSSTHRSDFSVIW